MTPRRAALWIGGSTMLAAWLAAAAAPSLVPDSVPQAPGPRMSAPDRAALELAVDADRLRERLNVVSSPRPATRNPFVFVSRAPGEAADRASGASTAAPVAPAAGPRVSLLGIAEDGPASGPVRTAIVSLAGELLLVKEGESLASGRYRVSRIGADAIELQDTLESRSLSVALP
jgi:hypothetical protein